MTAMQMPKPTTVQGVYTDATHMSTAVQQLVAGYVPYHSSLQPYSAHTATPIAAAISHVLDTSSRLPDPFLPPPPRLTPPGKPW